MNRTAGDRVPDRRRRARARLAAVLAALAAAVGCEDGGVGPEGQPFGRIGEVRIEVVSPVSQGAGRLSHTLIWSSSGPWRSLERIFLSDKVGDATERRSSADPMSLARTYASWIDLVNDSPSVALFGNVVDRTLVPTCDVPLSTVTVTIADHVRGDSLTWTRCSDRTMPTLSGAGAGPDPNASRVAQAAALVRTFTLDQQSDFQYQYNGSVGFGTLQRGGDAALLLTTPRVIEDEIAWRQFWIDLTGTTQAPPAVNFATDLVLVGVVGQREEAGDSVEIRGVLPLGNGTQISLWERRPGNFCTPARRTHVPYHIVVARKEDVARPIYFSDVSVDMVPCG